MTIGMETRLQQREQVLSQHPSGNLILLPLDTGEYYALNEVGARIWELCDGSRTVAELVEDIGREYDAPLDVIKADVLEILTDLSAEKLLVPKS